MTIDLNGKVALVSGAGRGIGKAIALALGNAGASVAVHYVKSAASADEVAENAGNGSCTFSADLQDADACRKLCKDVSSHFGRLDILVNNAGIALEVPVSTPFETWTHAWDQTMDVNLRAPAILIKEFMPIFFRQGCGRIINIASRAAFRGDTEDYLAYASSKAGMVSLSRSIARAFGKQGIVSFVVAPGFVRTDMAQQFIDTYGETYATDDLALSKLTEPADIAPTVVFLASGHMDHATGCTIDINAGSYIR